MKIGVPKEIKILEYRVGMVPAGVRELVHDGHEVIVETKAGVGIGMTDADYEAAGATVVSTAKEVFAQAELIVKVKEPQLEECAMLRPEQVLFTYLHLAADPAQAEALVKSGVTAIAYETVTAKDGSLPLLTPMSEVAGRLSIQAGAYALQKANGGCGVLLGGVPGVAPGKVLVVGGGVAGTNAAEMAVGLGAQVTILDRSVPRLREINDIYGGRVRTEYSTKHAMDVLTKDADLIVTDVWASMGQEEEANERAKFFAPCQVNAELMAVANDNALFMHCLPAHRGEEVTAEVIDGKQSVVWDEAENRLHSQKALLEFLLKQH